MSHKTFVLFPLRTQFFYCNDFNLIHFSSNFIHKKTCICSRNMLQHPLRNYFRSNKFEWKIMETRKRTLVLNNVIMVSWALFHSMLRYLWDWKEWKPWAGDTKDVSVNFGINLEGKEGIKKQYFINILCKYKFKYLLTKL